MRPEVVALLEAHRRAAEAGLKIGGEAVQGEASRRAPIGPSREQGGRPSRQPGTLRASGHVGDVEWHGDDASIEISFNTVYARRQHEETTWRHPQGGEAHYLQNAVQMVGPLVPGIIAAELKKELGT